MSIMSFKDRGPWGDSSWRGNCSGHVYRELFERLKPNVFVDPMVGSGTSVQVAQEMNIESYGLDLHNGFNCLRDSILQRVGKHADLVVSHPPYGPMIKYSGHVWGSVELPDDLSYCKDDDDFHQKMQLVLMNQREATRVNGYYGAIVGDLRCNGRYVSYQAEMISRLPANELAAVLIKAQHNTQSASKSYGRMTLPFITHEYIVLWQRKSTNLLRTLHTVAVHAQKALIGTWINVVKQALIGLNGQATLSALYEKIAESPKAAENANWQAKVRQTLNQNLDYFKPVQRGEWSLA